MKLDDHPTVRRFRLQTVPPAAPKSDRLDPAWLKQLVQGAGADDVGFVEIGRPELDDQRDDILKAFPRTRTLISFVVRMNREAIRTPAIGMGASTVSAHPEVRAALLDLQRQQGRDGGVVLEGRDIGTVVFPDAEVKFFLTARPEVRAKRRYDELRAKGEDVTLEQTFQRLEGSAGGAAVTGKLTGVEIALEFLHGGEETRVTGTVDGDRILVWTAQA